MVEGVVWSNQTLTELEDDDWGEPTYQSYVVCTGHRLRKKKLCDFTAEDLRFMLGQQISLSVLMPMAIDYLELVDPFAGGDMNHGTLLFNALKVDQKFWQENPKLWYRMNVILVTLHSFHKFISEELLPASDRFEKAQPS